MCKLSEIEIRKIRNGDNSPFNRLYADNYDDLIKGLRGKTKSKYSIEDMEDAIQEAFFVITKKVRKPNFRNDNICGFIVGIAYNKLRDDRKKTDRMQGFEVDEIERYISRKQGIHDEDFSPKFSNLNDEQRRKVDIILKALEKLSDNCRNLLTKLWEEEKNLEEVRQELEYASNRVVITTKSRCVKKLRKEINDLLNSDKQK